MDHYGGRYISNNPTTPQQRGIITQLYSCRTSLMDRHYLSCNNCSYSAKAYNSCRNRHCPRCQQKDKLEWMVKRMSELLPVGYYHLVYTLPHELNLLCLHNKKEIYNLLFKAASQSIIELAKDPKHLGADIGLLTVLHTWGQNMMQHPHLHCIMPAGGLSFDKEYWVHTHKKDDFFIHYKVLSRKFRGKFLALLKEAYLKNKLVFKGNMKLISGKRKFGDFINALREKDWVVNIQKPMGSPEKILEYLSRYVFKIAISDARIKKIKNGKVHFTWKNNRNNGQFGVMKLDIDEFIRRFLLHVLPKGFTKVRHYGIFCNRYRAENILLARELINEQQLIIKEEAIEDGQQVFIKQDTVWNEILTSIHTIKQPNCPICKKGRLYFDGIVHENAEEFG